MLSFARTCDAIAATTKKLEKTALVATYLRSSPQGEAAIAAIFLSGRPFPAYEEATLQVGGALLWRVIGELSGKTEHELGEIYRRHGDAGSVAAEALPARPESGLSLTEVQRTFYDMAAARGPAAKASLLRGLLERATPLEAKYIVKIISGDLRIGLKESLVEEAIARAFEAPLGELKRANMLLYDGIRAQAHVSGGEVRIFSRTRDEITESFPELPMALGGLPKDAVLDGEIVAWNAGDAGVPARALPFSKLQQRLGRKKVSGKLLRDVPVAYLVFDVLYADGELLLDRPLCERARILDSLLNELLAAPHVVTVDQRQAQSSLGFDVPDDESPLAPVLRAPVATPNSADDLDALFTAARERGNEGLMIKDLDSLYTPGRRGKSWLKMKRELATLDVVVTAVEYGHGKRIGVLSDYTFAVWDGERLVNIGKAYSGLTDAEISEMTQWFLAHKISEEGLRLRVEPKIVLEVAFNNMMRSTRHESGYTLRFPRIVRLRPDKGPEAADTIETVREIYGRQHSG